MMATDETRRIRIPPLVTAHITIADVVGEDEDVLSHSRPTSLLDRRVYARNISACSAVFDLVPMRFELQVLFRRKWRGKSGVHLYPADLALDQFRMGL
jgi:hypothetical protein